MSEEEQIYSEKNLECWVEWAVKVASSELSSNYLYIICHYEKADTKLKQLFWTKAFTICEEEYIRRGLTPPKENKDNA